MNREEAIKAMLEGKKVRINTWFSNVYCYFDIQCTQMPFRHVSNSGDDIMSNFLLHKENIWELYVEPKQKIKKWQWIIKLSNNITEQLTVGFYKNAKKVLEDYHSSTIIQQADWTMIEVEDE